METSSSTEFITEMASAEVEAVPKPAEESSEAKSFVTQVADLPVVMEAVKQLGMLYNNVKERNSVTKMACEAGETMSAATMPLIQAASSKAMAIGPVDYAGNVVFRLMSTRIWFVSL